MPTHKKVPGVNYPRAGWTAEPPRTALTGTQLQRQVSEIVNWRMNGPVLAYVGPPDTTLNPYDGEYCVILSSPERYDAATTDERYLCIAFQYWQDQQTGKAAPSITWTDPDANVQTIWDPQIALPLNTTNVAYGARLHPSTALYCTRDTSQAPISWVPDGTNEFRYGTITTSNIVLASLTVWEIPHPTLTTTQEQITQAGVACGEVIRGYDSGLSRGLGGIAHVIGDGTDPHVETVERMSRRCYLGWSHPVGIWIDNTLADNIFNELSIKTRPRNLYDVSVRRAVYPVAVVYQVGAIDNTGAQIIVYNADEATTWTWTSPGITGPTLVTYADGTPSTGLAIDYGEGDKDILFGASVQASDELLIRAVSLWEGPGW